MITASRSRIDSRVVIGALLLLGSAGSCRDKGGCGGSDGEDDGGMLPALPPGFVQQQLHFGRVAIDVSRTQWAEFRNPSRSDLRIDELVVVDGGFRLLDDGDCGPGTTLRAGDSCEIEVGFTSVGVGLFEGRLTLGYTDSEQTSTVDLPLAAEGQLMCTQRVAPKVLHARGLGSSSGARGDEECRAEYLVRLRELVPELNALFPEVTLDPDRIHVYDGPGTAWATDVDDAALGADLDPRRVLGLAMEVEQNMDGEWTTTGVGTDCVIHFTHEGLCLPEPQDRDTILVHELFHCYQFTLHDLELMQTMPEWMIEGAATWVGEQYAQGSPIMFAYAQRYMTDPIGLFSRSYDAYPFFAHMWRQGVDVHGRLIAASREGVDSVAFDVLSTGDGGHYVETWPTGLWLDDTRGSDWDTAIPGAPVLPAYPRHRIEEAEVTGGVTIDVPNVTPTHASITFPTDTFFRVSVSGVWGGLFAQSVDGGRFEPRVQSEDRAWVVCVGLDCTCEGGGRPPILFEELGTDLDIAVVGNNQDGFVRIEPINPGCCEGGEIDPRLVGEWTLVNETARNIGTTPPLLSEAVACPGYSNLDPVCINGLTGSHTLRIDSDGALTKTYSELSKFYECEHSETLHSSGEFWMTGTVHGCLSVNEVRTLGHGYEVAEVELSDIVDLTYSYTAINGEIVPPNPGLEGEHLYMRTAPAPNGVNQLGAFLFDGDDLINGREPHARGDVCDPHRRFEKSGH